MTKEFLPSMKERNSGHIVAISSASAIMALGNASAYSSCKSAVRGEFHHGIRETSKIKEENSSTIESYFPQGNYLCKFFYIFIK